MALFQQTNKDPNADVKQLMAQGYSDSEIMEELAQKGYRPEQIHNAIAQIGSQMPRPEEMPQQNYSQQEQQYQNKNNPPNLFPYSKKTQHHTIPPKLI